MLLPTPTAEEVVKFQDLYKQLYGIDLPVIEAQLTLTRMVQLYYLTGGHDAYRQRAQQETSSQINRSPVRK